MKIVFLLRPLFVLAVFVGHATSMHKFSRVLNLENLLPNESPSSTSGSGTLPDCAGLCARDDLCISFSITGGQCSIYRTSLTTSEGADPGARSYKKEGAAPQTDSGMAPPLVAAPP
ncbi:uncharacterized protein LOC124133626 [Haliotis rufescens]|uniref:uncharacterized protein LOC124133626 n=1 Tax=Haliotis rufescens TaxID=6454 RepID=UPI001EB09560|nr:uncharacterized protein LOC124133626 [Haliotis rufescens]